MVLSYFCFELRFLFTSFKIILSSVSFTIFRYYSSLSIANLCSGFLQCLFIYFCLTVSFTRKKRVLQDGQPLYMLAFQLKCPKPPCGIQTSYDHFANLDFRVLNMTLFYCIPSHFYIMAFIYKKNCDYF